MSWPRLRRTAYLLASLMPVMVGGQQATPPSPPPTPRPGPPATFAPDAKGIIAGQVIDGDSGRGVSDAIVRIGPRLSTVGPSGAFEENLSAYTSGMRYIVGDAEGRFVIRNVPAGSYAIVLQTPGYVASAYGHQRPGGVTRELVLEADQRVTDVVVKGWKNAVISGTVTDEAGEPLVGATVRALRQTFAGGHQVLAATLASARTDDRGEYRLIRLEPGSYAVVVGSGSATVPAPVNAGSTDAAQANPTILSRDGYSLSMAARYRALALPAEAARNSVYPTMFHPAAQDPARAGVISLKSGDVRAGVDISLRPVQASSISGRVISPDGNPGGVSLTLIPASAGAFAAPNANETPTATSSGDGRFMFLSVPEGQYAISVTKVQRAAAPGTTTSFQVGNQTTSITSVSPSGPTDNSAAPILWARVPVSVGAGAPAEVTVPLAEGARVSGSVVFDGTSPPPATGSSGGAVSLLSADGRAIGEFPMARLGVDRRFTTAQYPPGKYYLSMMPIGGRWSLKSITVNGKDALRAPLTLEGEDIAGAVVTFTDRPSAVSGAVRDRNGATADATVVLFPSDYRSWIDAGMPSRLLRVVDTSRDGAYRVADVPSGEYVVVAYPANVTRSPQDPAFIVELAAMATRLSLLDAEQKTVALTVAAIR